MTAITTTTDYELHHSSTCWVPVYLSEHCSDQLKQLLVRYEQLSTTKGFDLLKDVEYEDVICLMCVFETAFQVSYAQGHYDRARILNAEYYWIKNQLVEAGLYDEKRGVGVGALEEKTMDLKERQAPSNATLEHTTTGFTDTQVISSHERGSSSTRRKPSQPRRPKRPGRSR